MATNEHYEPVWRVDDKRTEEVSMMSIKGYSMAENSWYKINVSSVYDFEIESSDMCCCIRRLLRNIGFRKYMKLRVRNPSQNT